MRPLHGRHTHRWSPQAGRVALVGGGWERLGDLYSRARRRRGRRHLVLSRGLRMDVARSRHHRPTRCERQTSPLWSIPRARARLTLRRCPAAAPLAPARPSLAAMLRGTLPLLHLLRLPSPMPRLFFPRTGLPLAGCGCDRPRLGAGGIVLLGEQGKLVPLSAYRFSVRRPHTVRGPARGSQRGTGRGCDAAVGCGPLLCPPRHILHGGRRWGWPLWSW